MVLARVAEYFSSAPSTPSALGDESSVSRVAPDGAREQRYRVVGSQEEVVGDTRERYPHVMLAGGLGGLTGDMLMHSLDTVKTRQQGDPHRPPKYNSLGATYWTIFRQEGVPRGLYGGVLPAAIGSFGGTCLFFGGYEWSKRLQIDFGVAPSIAYLTAGLIADVIASPLYVPTEVLKTRLQLQGRYNNPHFQSGYNYRSTFNALKTIVRTEGVQALFYGYKATLYRDLPFSALQFLFYEKEREFAKWWKGSKDLGIPLEVLTGATAGGMAGTLTCPLDVVKTRIQTQVSPKDSRSPTGSSATTAASRNEPQASRTAPSKTQKRHISTTSPPRSIPKPGSVRLETSSVLVGLRLIYKSEGIAGWFRGVGPRAVWTSVQSGAMFVLYQRLLSWFEANPLVADE